MSKENLKCEMCESVFQEYLSNRRLEHIFCSKKCYAIWLQKKVGRDASQYRHGMTGTKLHKKWCSMIQRCTDKNYRKYQIYGGRGIRVTPQWLVFENFCKDMFQSYKTHVEKFGEKNTTLERKDVNGNYELKNCRWATHLEQGNNRRDNIRLAWKGKTFTISEWSVRRQIPYRRLYMRIRKYGWPVDRALSE